ncbi:hypothetical protein ACW9H6_22200 [Pseudomonas sp. SDO528_S397]
MSLNIADKVFLSIVLVDFAGIFIWIGVCLHLAYTQMDLMLAHLKNCSAIMSRAPLRHGGPWGKLLLIGGISGIVTFPGFYLKRGGMSVEDLENLPAPLKRKLLIIQWVGIGLFFVMCSFGAAIKLGLI